MSFFALRVLCCRSRYYSYQVLKILYVCLLCSPSLLAASVELPERERAGAMRPGDLGSEGVEASERPGAVRPAIEIPRMVDRPFTPEDGPFIQVSEINLIDAEDLPQYGISLEEIDAIIDAELAEQPQRGFSIAELQEVADKITSYYRSKGLILASATIPVQTVEGSTVDMQVFIGILGQVLVEGNERYTEKVLQRPFATLIGKPVTKQGIEKALLTITDFPGLIAYGVFQPGIRVGEADITVTIQDEDNFDFTVGGDNHGLDETGIYRTRASITFNNPTAGADRVTISGQKTFKPDLSDFWSMEYERYLTRGLSFGLNFFRNQFDVKPTGEESVTGISAVSQQGGGFLEYQFLRSRQENLSTRFSFQRKHSETELDQRVISRTDLSVASLNLSYDVVDTFHPLRFLYDAVFNIGDNFGGGLTFTDLQYSFGVPDFLGSQKDFDGPPPADVQGPSRRLQGGAFASSRFHKFLGTLSRLQLLSPNQSLRLRGELQYTEDALTSLEQYSIGGPNNVRAYPEAQELYDKAAFFSVDYIINAPFFADAPAFGNRTWGELLQFSVFYDFAVGKLNKPINPGEPNNPPISDRERDSIQIAEKGVWVPYSGYGLSLYFNLPGTLNSRVIWSRPISPSDIGREPDNGERNQFWGDITYSF